MANPSHVHPQRLGLSSSVMQRQAQGEYLAIEGPLLPYVADAEVRVYAMGRSLPTEAALNVLHTLRTLVTALRCMCAAVSWGSSACVRSTV